MKIEDPAVLGVVSEILANLAAGWFGLVLVSPNFSVFGLPEILVPLLYNIALGIVFAVGAIMLRKLAKV